MAGQGWEKLTRVDPLTQSTITVSYAHHEIHDGRGFHLDHQASLGSGDTINIAFTTSNSIRQMHMVWAARSSGESNIQLIEAPTLAGGTAAAPRNRNRNSTNTTTATGFVTDATTVTGGTVLETDHLGAGKQVGGSSRGVEEWVLKQNTAYAVVMTSEAVGNDCSFKLEWYEHRDKRTG